MARLGSKATKATAPAGWNPAWDKKTGSGTQYDPWCAGFQSSEPQYLFGYCPLTGHVRYVTQARVNDNPRRDYDWYPRLGEDRCQWWLDTGHDRESFGTPVDPKDGLLFSIPIEWFDRPELFAWDWRHFFERYGKADLAPQLHRLAMERDRERDPLEDTLIGAEGRLDQARRYMRLEGVIAWVSWPGEYQKRFMAEQQQREADALATIEERKLALAALEEARLATIH